MDKESIKEHETSRKGEKFGLINSPWVSVLMGVYHPSSDITALRRSVDSILNQTVSNFEFLICDDGSSEEVKSFLEQQQRTDSRIQLVRKENALSLPAKLNLCLKQAKGQFIARMDDDDVSHPERFQKQIDYLRSHPEVSFVGSNVMLFRKGIAVKEKQFPEFPSVQDFYITQPYIHPALLFRKECLITVQGYSEEKTCILCEDYDLLLRLYAAGYQGANMQEILFDYTIPLTAKGNRKMRHRWNETVTRCRRFGELKLLPGAFPYVLKPLVVGMLPEMILNKIKNSKLYLENK